MEIYKKLQECRKEIKASPLKKEGKNSFSNYDYFTPAQVEKLVFDVCIKHNLFCKFDLVRTELGLIGELTITDLDTENSLIAFQMATDIPEIKATNIAQQLGGTMTYTERYLKMTAFGIVDNTLDFDSHDNTKKPEQKKQESKSDDNKPWLNEGTEPWTKVIDALNSGQYTIEDVKKKYQVSKINEAKLNSI